MFDDAKYMAKEAVDRNNALGALDQMPRRRSTAGGRNRLRRFFGVVLGVVVALSDRHSTEPAYLRCLRLGLASRLRPRTQRYAAAPAGPIGRIESRFWPDWLSSPCVVALSAQTDVISRRESPQPLVMA